MIQGLTDFYCLTIQVKRYEYVEVTDVAECHKLMLSRHCMFELDQLLLSVQHY